MKELLNYQIKDIWGKKHEVQVIECKKGVRININGRYADKCSLSNYFKAYTYYAIYWDKANYQHICAAFIEERETTYKRIDY